MTNEQRVRVDRLERYLITDREKTYTTVRVNDLDTALSLIKEQKKKIENLQKELNEENKRCMILANNDKFKEQVIELMSELVYERFKPELLLEYGFESKEQFKQYFAELVRKE